jgi:dTDP-glucose pyrophosphorylase
MLGLQAAGIREMFVVTGFKAETIEEYFGDGSRWGWRVHYGRQVVQDGTGRAPEVAREFVGDSPFLLTYGDILVRPETYQRMRERFAGGDYAGLLTVTAGEDVSKGAVVVLDAAFDFVTLVEKPGPAQLAELRGRGLLREGGPYWYNAGIYIFRPCLYEFTARLQKSPRGEYELTDAITAMAAAGHRLAGLAIEGRWVDVRDPEVLARLEQEEGAA